MLQVSQTQRRTPMSNQALMSEETRLIGVALLVLETWIASVVAFVCLPPHAGFWLTFLPFALLLPANGLISAMFSRWKALGVSFGFVVSVPFAALLLRPVVFPWVVDVVLRARLR
jgi:hypothetical protein